MWKEISVIWPKKGHQQKCVELPYGVSDFDIVRRDNLYYVDKTMYLPKLEASLLFFITMCEIMSNYR